MGVSSAADQRASTKALASRPNREDRSLPSYLDKLFSDWKLLVGPDDWQNCYMGLEGTEKYRLHNLPSTNCFNSGVYELALYLDKSNHGDGSGKGTSRRLKKHTLVPTYVGQAENVRNRLQDYGRCGSHLEGSSGLLQNKQCLQCAIIFFRVPQTKFGVVEKIVNPLENVEEEFCSCPHLFTSAFRQGYYIAYRWTATKSKVDAAALEASLLQSYNYAWNRGSNGERRPEEAFKKLQHIKTKSWYDALKWIIKLPKIGSSKVRNLHKKRIALIAVEENLWRHDNPARRPAVSAEDIRRDSTFLTFWRREARKEKSMPSVQLICSRKYNGRLLKEPDNTSVCGIIDGNGIVCKSMPVPGRKRCEMHKGMRLHIKPVHANISTREHNVMGPSEIGVCGIVDGHGVICKDKPLPGRKRCEVHKGMRLPLRPMQLKATLRDETSRMSG